MLLLLPFVLYSFIDVLDHLGSIKNHTLKYFTHIEMTYNLADISQLLPVHIFTMLYQSDV